MCNATQRSNELSTEKCPLDLTTGTWDDRAESNLSGRGRLEAGLEWVEWQLGASELERTIIGDFSESFNAKGSGELKCWPEGNARATGGSRPPLEDTKPSLC